MKLKDRIKNALTRLYQRSYGLDDLNKFIIIVSFVMYIIFSFVFRNNRIMLLLPLLLMFIYIFRFFSTNKIARLEENRKFNKFTKYYKMKWTYRKTHRIYKCKTCGQLIRVPKGKGKIETTCPSCGAKETHIS